MDTPIYTELAAELGVDIPEQRRPSPRPRAEQPDTREDDDR